MNYEWTNPLTNQKEQAETDDEARKRAWDQLHELWGSVRACEHPDTPRYIEVTRLVPFPHRGFTVRYEDPAPEAPEPATPPEEPEPPSTPSQRIEALRARAELFNEAVNLQVDPMMRMLVLAQLETAAALERIAVAREQHLAIYRERNQPRVRSHRKPVCPTCSGTGFVPGGQYCMCRIGRDAEIYEKG